MRQLPLDLGRRTALGREAFLVAPSNATALAMIDDWQRWPAGKLVLTGPQGAGKTHLAHVWAEMAGARVANAAAPPDITTLAAGAPLVLEDVDRAVGDGARETALFHLHNHVLDGGGRLLVTGRTPPSRWSIGLPDLRSRLEAASVVALDPPDDSLLAGVIVKLFADRQIRVEPPVVAFLLSRIERSVAAAEAVVNRLDEVALAENRELRVPLARKVLGDEA